MLFRSEMIDETVKMSKARHSTSVGCFDGIIREMNQKYNSVADMCEKKFGTPVLKRNGLSAFCHDRFVAAGLIDTESDERLKTVRGMRR